MERNMNEIDKIEDELYKHLNMLNQIELNEEISEKVFIAIDAIKKSILMVDFIRTEATEDEAEIGIEYLKKYLIQINS
jgi:hypothetical protein